MTDAVIVAAAPNAQLTLVSNTSFAGQFVGLHFITPLESGDGSNSQTSVGDVWMGLTVKLRM